MLLKIEMEGKTPVYRQICDQVSRLVENGALLPGSRLPPTRLLASRLGLNRSTVYRAYQELWARGYLESRPGSDSTVRGRLKALGGAGSGPSGRISWETHCPPASRRIHEEYQALLRLSPKDEPHRVISFAGLSADRELCPAAELRGTIREVLLSSGKQLLDYGDPQGCGPLREVIARRMQIHSVSVTPEEVLVTGGSQHALDLVLRLLGRAGSLAAVESPTYSHVLPLFRFQGFRFLELPMREDGLDLEVFERRLKKRRPALLYTIPNFQNPTGITTSQAHRERLLALCERHEVPLVEDGFEEEMKYFGKAVLPVKSMDAAGIVIYLGTFSKVVFPGLRVGWIAGDREIIQRLLALCRFSSLSGNQVTQAAVARFCEDGRYEQHLRRVHGAYRARMTAMLRGLKQHLPERGVAWTQPAGGYTLWVKTGQASRGRGRASEVPGPPRRRRRGREPLLPGRPEGLCLRLSVSNQTRGDDRGGVSPSGEGPLQVHGGLRCYSRSRNRSPTGPSTHGGWGARSASTSFPARARSARSTAPTASTGGETRSPSRGCSPRRFPRQRKCSTVSRRPSWRSRSRRPSSHSQATASPRCTPGSL